MVLLAMRAGPPRRRPYPTDIVLAGYGFMVGTDGPDGQQMVLQKPPDQAEVSPTDYGYSGQSPVLETIASYDDLSLGYGLAIQETRADRRYKYATNVDCSVPRAWFKGPALTTGTPATRDSTVGITRFFDAGGVRYALNGRYCLARSTDTTFTVAKDFGAGKSATDVVVFYDNSSGGGQFAYVAMGDTEAVWRLGPTWEVQTVVVSGTPTGGTYRLFWGGVGTPALAYTAVAADVQAGLRQVPGLESVTVATSGTAPNYTHTVTFAGVTTNPAQLTSSSALTGGTPVLTHATPTPFVAAAWEQRVEVQTVAVAGTPTGGTYTLTYNAATTATIAYNASGATVQAALRLLSGLGSVTVATTGTSPNFTHTVTFTGVGAQGPLLIPDATGLTGGTPAMTAARTQAVLTARAWAVVGREFYRSPKQNLLAKVDVDADPWVEANWGALNQFTIGDKSASVVRLGVTASGALVVFKTDGIYTLDAEGQSWALFPHLRAAAAAGSGEPLGAWRNDLYVTYRTGAYRLSVDLALTEIGPARDGTNVTPVKGQISAYCGDEAKCLYGGIYNQDTGDSYLLKFGAWTGGGKAPAEHLDVWHGSITPAFVGKKITCLDKSAIGAPTDHARMWIGFSDGTHAVFVLPCDANPLNCASYAYSTTDGDLYFPAWHGMFESDPKSLRAVTASLLAATGADYATYSYRTDSGAAWSSLDTAFSTVPRHRVNFVESVAGVLLEQRLTLVTAATSFTVQVAGFGLHHQLRTALFQVLEVNILCADGLLKRDNTPVRLSGSRLRALCESLAATTSSFALITPDEVTREVTVVGINQHMAWNQRLRRWQSAVKLRLAERVLSSVAGTYGRLEAYTYGQLEASTYGQLENI